VLRQALAKLSQHTLTYAVAEQLGRLAGFLLLPLTTGYLSRSDFATRDLLTTTLALLAQLCGINVTAAMSRLYFDDTAPAHRRVVLSTSIASVSGVALLASVALGALAPWWAHWLPTEATDLTRLVQIALGIFFFQTLRELQNKVLQTQERSKLYGALSVTKVVFEITAQIVALVVLERGLEGLLWAALISEATFSLVLAAILAPSIGIGLSSAVFASLFAYSLPLIPNGVLQFCLHSLDRYLIGSISGADQLGLYALAYKLGYVPNYLVLGPFLLIWYPFVFSITDDSRQRELVARLIPIFMLVMTAAAFGVALFAEEIVHLASSRALYYRAWTAVPLVSFGYWLWGLFQLLQTGFYARKVTRSLPALTAAAVLVNAFSNLVLLPAIGFEGAAVATVLAFGALCVATADRASRVYPLVIAWRRVLGPCAVAVMLVLAAIWIAPQLESTWRLPLKAALLALWAPAAWFTGLGAPDRAQAWAFVRERRTRTASGPGPG